MQKSFKQLMCRTLLVLVTVFLNSGIANAGKRIALIVGNSTYENAPNLKNPINDAKLMAETLAEAGFEVTSVLDADYRKLKGAMLKFGAKLRESPDAGLFYYAGHGVQVRGENYLIPVDAKINDEDDIDLEAIKVNDFLRTMNSSNSNINIVVLDACRNNPFARSFRSVSRGLAPVDAPKGTYVAYATAPGDVAQDGTGNNSPYTVALASAIKQRGVTIEKVFKTARKSVLKETNSTQVPWETSSITGDFYFFNPDKPKVAEKIIVPQKVKKTSQTIVTAPIANTQRDEAGKFYNFVRDSNSILVLQTFADKFPDSFYATLAKARISELQQQKNQNNLRIENSAEKKNAQIQLTRLDEAESRWNTLQHSSDRAELKAFSNEYAGTRFAKLALSRSERLENRKKLVRKPRIGSAKTNAQLRLEKLDEADREWGSLKNSDDLVALKEFSRKYSGTAFANLALVRRQELTREQNLRSFPQLSGGDLFRGLQIELNRLGCDAGKADGKWGNGSKKALLRYQDNLNTQLSSLSPSNDLLEKLRSGKPGHCPLVCKIGFGEKNNQCVRIAPSQQIKSDACRKSFAEFKTKGVIGAFAITGDGKSCGSAWNYGTQKLARDRAIVECKKQGTGCHVIVQTNPARLPTGENCKKDFAKFKGKAGFKAFALSGSGQACGWSSNYGSKREARKRALLECRKNQKGCRIILSR